MPLKPSHCLPLIVLTVSACSADDSGVEQPISSNQAALAGAESYVIVYKDNAVPADAGAAIDTAGGTLVTAYPALGVAIATSSDPSFADAMTMDASVEAVSGTSSLATKLDIEQEARPHATSALAPDSSGDPLSGLQWNMDQIHAPEAHSINPGSSSVIAGVVDSGIDIRHPDLATQVEASASVSCVGGVPNTDPAAWGTDFFGHGTHVGGIIAAADNDIGVIGVAPGVRLASIKVVNDYGLIYPEDFICGITWAADHGVQLANVSLTIDPWYFACRSDPAQRAIWDAVQRAIRYAMSKGTTVVAALGNSADDLGHPTIDYASPTDGTPTARELQNNCGVLPAEVPGVIGVSAVGPTQQKAFYSNYGVGAVDVSGPGGDFLVITPEAETGQVVSALPEDSLFYMFARDFWGTAYQDCSSGTCVTYGGLQGTSMAAPHVTGVAALALSRYGKMLPRALASTLQQTATPLACPANPYQQAEWVPPAICRGSEENNNFYGSGEVDALAVVQ